MKIASSCPLIDVKKAISNDSIIGKKQKVWKNNLKNKIFCFCECCWTKDLDSILRCPCIIKFILVQQMGNEVGVSQQVDISCFMGLNIFCKWFETGAHVEHGLSKKMYTQGCYWRAKKRTTHFFANVLYIMVYMYLGILLSSMKGDIIGYMNEFLINTTDIEALLSGSDSNPTCKSLLVGQYFLCRPVI